MKTPTRRTFLRAAALTTAALPAAAFAAAYDTPPPAQEFSNVFGPRKGYSPQIGIFVSQLTWMRGAVTGPVSHPALTVEQLDWLLDKNANTIGALLLHLAATETYYQLNTFEGIHWGSLSRRHRQKMGPRHEPRRRWPRHHQGPRATFLPRQPPPGPRKDPRRVQKARRRLVLRRRPDLALGTRPTTSASGSTSASTSPTTPARSSSSSSAPPATKNPANHPSLYE